MGIVQGNCPGGEDCPGTIHNTYDPTSASMGEECWNTKDWASEHMTGPEASSCSEYKDDR